MKLTFQIEYRTTWGEEVGVVLDGNHRKVIRLSTQEGSYWKASVEMSELSTETLVRYRYGIYRNGECVRRESGNIAHLFCPSRRKNSHYILNDFWKDLPANSFLYSSAFSSKCRTVNGIQTTTNPNGSVTFRVLCPCLHLKRQVLGISGNCAALGNWNGGKALQMKEIQPNEWHVTLDATSLIFPLEYKYVACSEKDGRVEEWEMHDNRVLSDPHVEKNEFFLMPETEVCFASVACKVAGIAIPVFSLRSEKSFGVGDFGDLKMLIDWAVETHQQAVQILPINDTTLTHTRMDSYPYNSISIYAFHPMYLDLRQLGKMKDKEQRARFTEKQQVLNAFPTVRYEEVNEAKQAYTKQMFQQDGVKTLTSVEFGEFFDKNKHWLLPYAAFCYLRDVYSTPDFNQWPAYQQYDAEEIAALCAPESPCYNEIAFYYYVQYHLHIQLLAVGNYAREKGIILKGDIPIGISRHSVEAWTEPHYFNMDGQAGAPPDAFADKNGQNWGFPTYNWEAMEQDNYLWWKKRFCKMAEYFTAYRIDHILGFFRIWEIPSHSVHGLLGQFSPALPLSADEIQDFGLPFQKEFMTCPFINEDMLQRVFGEKAGFVKETFLNHCHDDIYELRSEYDTQRKVEAWFQGKTDEENVNLREGIYTLISNVLFLPDHEHPSLYHPRIAVQEDFIFERLNEQEKAAFNRLYNHYYYQRHNTFWYKEAMKKLPVLTQATSMLVCGEDLGMVPDCVSWVMEKVQILSLEIQRMSKNPEHGFGHVWENPYRSVCTISTHDMSPLRGWWEEAHEEACRYYNYVLGHGGEAPATATGEICEEIVCRHLECPSLLCILSFQDWLSVDEDIRFSDAKAERINVPADPKNYWKYRMHLTLEELMNNKKFNDKIRKLIDASGRG